MSEFEDVVRKMPPSWHCVRCNREWPNSPRGPHSVAYVTEMVQAPDGRFSRRIVGELCKDCSEVKTQEKP